MRRFFRYHSSKLEEKDDRILIAKLLVDQNNCDSVWDEAYAQLNAACADAFFGKAVDAVPYLAAWGIPIKALGVLWTGDLFHPCFRRRLIRDDFVLADEQDYFLRSEKNGGDTIA